MTANVMGEGRFRKPREVAHMVLFCGAVRLISLDETQMTPQRRAAAAAWTARKAGTIALILCYLSLRWKQKETTMRKYVLSIATLAAMSAPAFAAEFYVVRDPDTKQCRVVETRPTDTKIVVMGDKVFTTRDEAQKQVTVLCK